MGIRKDQFILKDYSIELDSQQVDILRALVVESINSGNYDKTTTKVLEQLRDKLLEL